MKSAGKKSAGLLAFRGRGATLEFFLAHMGGPFWARKDDHAWTIPKGEFDEEIPLDAALREFQEEIGSRPDGPFIELTPVKTSGGKTIFAFAVEWDCDPALIKSNMFSMEWPKDSGRMQEFPEIDRAGWFAMEEAQKKILKSQIPLLLECARAEGR
jgi:predicted NUDIX family NTP pyrophosphohydrolase